MALVPPFLAVHFKCAPNYFHFPRINFVLILVLRAVIHDSTVIDSLASSCGPELTTVEAGCYQVIASGFLLL